MRSEIDVWKIVARSGWLVDHLGFNGAETNCGIAHILGILLMNSYNTDIFFNNYYNKFFAVCPLWIDPLLILP